MVVVVTGGVVVSLQGYYSINDIKTMSCRCLWLLPYCRSQFHCSCVNSRRCIDGLLVIFAIMPCEFIIESPNGVVLALPVFAQLFPWYRLL